MHQRLSQRKRFTPFLTVIYSATAADPCTYVNTVDSCFVVSGDIGVGEHVDIDYGDGTYSAHIFEVHERACNKRPQTKQLEERLLDELNSMAPRTSTEPECAGCRLSIHRLHQSSFEATASPPGVDHHSFCFCSCITTHLHIFIIILHFGKIGQFYSCIWSLSLNLI